MKADTTSCTFSLELGSRRNKNRTKTATVGETACINEPPEQDKTNMRTSKLPGINTKI